MLQNQINELVIANKRNQKDNEELEQYGRRLCLRFEGVETEENETSEKVLEKVVSMCKEAGVDVPNETLDRAHRIGKDYFHK